MLTSNKTCNCLERAKIAFLVLLDNINSDSTPDVLTLQWMRLKEVKTGNSILLKTGNRKFVIFRPLEAELDSLMLVLKGLCIGDGDEVIVPSNTFIATALAASYTRS